MSAVFVAQQFKSGVRVVQAVTSVLLELVVSILLVALKFEGTCSVSGSRSCPSQHSHSLAHESDDTVAPPPLGITPSVRWPE